MPRHVAETVPASGQIIASNGLVASTIGYTATGNNTLSFDTAQNNAMIWLSGSRYINWGASPENMMIRGRSGTYISMTDGMSFVSELTSSLFQFTAGGSECARIGKYASNFYGDVEIRNNKELQLWESVANGDAHYVGLKSPANLSSNTSYTLPGTAGADGQFLKTDGGQNLSWDSPGNITSFGVTASGYIPKFIDNSHITNSIIYDNGTYVGIGTIPGCKLHVYDATENCLVECVADGITKFSQYVIAAGPQADRQLAIMTAYGGSTNTVFGIDAKYGIDFTSFSSGGVHPVGHMFIGIQEATSSGAVIFGTQNVERVRINANGQIITGSLFMPSNNPILLGSSVPLDGGGTNPIVYTLKWNTDYNMVCYRYDNTATDTFLQLANWGPGTGKMGLQIQNSLSVGSETLVPTNVLTVNQRADDNGIRVNGYHDPTIYMKVDVLSYDYGRIITNASVMNISSAGTVNNTTTGTSGGWRGYMYGGANSSSYIDFYRTSISDHNYGIRFFSADDVAFTAEPIYTFESSTNAAGRLTAASGTQTWFKIAPQVTQTDTAGYIALYINPTQNSIGSGDNYLIKADVGGVNKFFVMNNGYTGIGPRLDITTGSHTNAEVYWADTNGTGFLLKCDMGLDQTLLAPSAGGGRQIIISDYANSLKDYDHATQTNPTLYIHSVVDPDSDNTQYGSLVHDQTNFRISNGKGQIKFTPTDYVSVSKNAFLTEIGIGNANREYLKLTQNASSGSIDGLLQLNLTQSVDNGCQGIRLNTIVTGASTNSYGYYDVCTVTGVALTNRYSMFISNPTGTGTITNNYGLYIENQTKGDTNYAIYSAGGTVRFAGVTLINTAPDDKYFAFYNSSKRWTWYPSGAEVGTNAGSDLIFSAYDDSGTFLSSPLFIKRSSGNVGFGTSNPQSFVHILTAGTAQAPVASTALTLQRSGAAGSSVYASLIAGNTGEAGIVFGDTDNNAIGKIYYDHATNKINFYASGATYASVDSTGLTVLGNVDASGHSVLAKITDNNTALTTDRPFRASIGAESYYRYEVYGDGKIQWGGGTVGTDTNLYRLAADVLATDDDFKFTNTAKGVILKSPNGTYYKMSVNDAGVISASGLP